MIRALLTAVALFVAAAPAARADDVADARARLKKGADLYRARKYRDAIAEFEAAYRLKPHGAIHFNVAQCREKLEEWPAALRSYTDYLREVPEAQDRAAVRAAMRRLEARIGAAGGQVLLVYSDPPGAEVRIDGRPRGRTPFHILLSPGSYRVGLALEGHAPAEEEVQVAATASRVLDVELRPERVRSGAISNPNQTSNPAPSPTPDPISNPNANAVPDLSPRPPSPLLPPVVPERPHARRRVYTWVAAGTAVAAAAAGAWFGVAAKQRSDQLRDGTTRTSAASLADDARSKARTANILYGVAGAAGAAGVTLFFVEGRF